MFLQVGFIEPIVRGWTSGSRTLRAAIIISIAATGFSIACFVGIAFGIFTSALVEPAGYLAAAIPLATMTVLSSYDIYVLAQQRRAKIEDVEREIRAHPERPQLAWDLARTKLESYLDRNLSQVRSIYWLTLLVMISGFGMVTFGIYHAMNDPTRLPISIVASASGILISLIGGSFLLIYRSILNQSKDYVTVLERINAVGMAVQVIASIPESDVTLKSQTTADLAKQLLNLYAVDLPSQKKKNRRGDQ
jgi:hypothetical protein